ncbi:hypothetical protein NDI45_25205 [Leptolyngbya sp. GB1-A1]
MSLPPGILEALERWAESEGNRPTSLANWIVETAVREAIERGKVPPPEEKTPSLPPADLKAFLTQLACGELPTNGQLVTLAHDLGVETEVLMELRDRVRRGNGNKKEGQTNGT